MLAYKSDHGRLLDIVFRQWFSTGVIIPPVGGESKGKLFGRDFDLGGRVVVSMFSLKRGQRGFSTIIDLITKRGIDSRL